MKSFIDLITVVLKIFLLFLTKWFAWKAEERARFEERMKNMTNLLKDAAEDRSESVNEDDYLSNVAWEVKQRYEAYKKEVATVLGKGGGIAELNLVKTMGMDLRVASKQQEVISILVKDVNVDEKSKLVAKVLSDL